MCLAVPGRIEDVRDERGTRMGTVGFDGIRKDVCLAYVPDADIGEYVLVHVGFAISKVDAATAVETIRIFRELGTLADELDAAGQQGGGLP